MTKNTEKRILGTLVFPTEKSLRDYCRAHRMRPETPWEVAETGRRGIGSILQQKNENGIGDSFRVKRILEHGIDRKIREALSKEREKDPAKVSLRIRRYLGTAENAIRSQRNMDAISSLLESLRREHEKAAEKRRFAILAALALPEEGRFLDFACDGKFPSERFQQLHEVLGFMQRTVSVDNLRNTRVRLLSRFKKHVELASSCTQIEAVGISPITGMDLDGKIRENPESIIYVREEDGSAGLAHEIAHAIQNANPDVARTCREFFEERTKGEKAISYSQAMKILYGKCPEEEKGYGFPVKMDHFLDPYCGCIDEQVDFRSHVKKSNFPVEILSCGVEFLFADPEMFFRSDPEYFRFVIQVLQRTASSVSSQN